MSKRPKYLNLVEIRLPLPAVVSFMHRVSGAVLFVALPVLLSWLQQSLASAQGFAALHTMFSHWSAKLLLMALLWAFFHHLFAGIRHLVMDIYLDADELPAGRFSAKLALGLGIAITVVAGVALW
jgi:succinate dehydrogenase / fumarate reductase cytochrome b subunit